VASVGQPGAPEIRFLYDPISVTEYWSQGAGCRVFKERQDLKEEKTDKGLNSFLVLFRLEAFHHGRLAL
jgi:hypothetical protein